MLFPRNTRTELPSGIRYAQYSLNELDFTLLKTFSLGESRRLEFRGEFFNLANHPTFAAPSTSINSDRARK